MRKPPISIQPSSRGSGSESRDLRTYEVYVFQSALEQEAALALVCEDCGSIGAGEGDLLQNLGLVPDPNTVTINAGDYVF